MSHSQYCDSPQTAAFAPLWFILKSAARVLLKKKKKMRSSHRGSVETNLTRNHEVVGLIPGFALWLKDLVLL